MNGKNKFRIALKFCRRFTLYTFFVIGLVWSIAKISWYEPNNYKIFYLPKMDAYICMRLFDDEYNKGEKYIDLVFGNSVEEAINGTPWNSDIIRITSYTSEQHYIAVQKDDNSVVYIQNHTPVVLICNKGSKRFVRLHPLDKHRITKTNLSTHGAESSDNHFSYRVECYPSHAAKDLIVRSLTSGEHIEEVKFNN